MHSKWVFKHRRYRPCGQIYVLCALWAISLLVGILWCCVNKSNGVAAILGVFKSACAPIPLFLVCVIPVCIPMIPLASPMFWLTCFLVFLTGVSRGFCGATVYAAAGDAAWLLRPLVLFSASGVSILMWWLLFRNKPGRVARRNFFFALVCACFIFCVDLFVISPIVGDFTEVILEGLA